MDRGGGRPQKTQRPRTAASSRTAVGTAAFSGVVLWLVIVAPATGGPTGATTLVAPYSFHHRYVVLSDSSATCRSQIGGARTWYAVLGQARASLSAQAASCGTGNGTVPGGFSTRTLEMGASYPFVATNWSFWTSSIQVNWNVSGTYNLSIPKLTNCTGPVLNTTGNGTQFCELYVAVKFGISGVLYQPSTGQKIASVQSSGLSAVRLYSRNETCVQFVCTLLVQTVGSGGFTTGSLPAKQSLTFSGVYLNHSRGYALNLTVFLQTQVVLIGFPHTALRAAIDLWSAGKAASMASIVVK